MRSNGGRGLVSEALSPDAAEGRRGEAAAALARPRSYGGTFSIGGASGERLTAVSVMGVSKLARWPRINVGADIKSPVYCILY